MKKINLSGFNHSSIVDGPGLRFTIYTQGCKHKCKGCHNPSTWKTSENKKYSISEIIDIVHDEALSKNVTISGGDPLLQIDNIFSLCKLLKEEDYNIWLYTGYTIDEIKADEKLVKILDVIDVLVDGKFEHDKKDFNLKYRGSSNQQIINLNQDK